MKKNSRFSIIAAVIALLILAVAAIGIGLYDLRAKTSPNEAVTRFYSSWIDALREGPNVPIERNLHAQSTYVTESFTRTVTRNVEQGRAPVICQSTAPASFTTDPAVIAEDGQRAAVTFRADTLTGRAVLVRDDRGWWRIDEVDCPPAPRPAATTTASTSTETGTSTNTD